MLKRSFDFLGSLFGLIFTLPIMLPAIIAVWLQDFKSPFYIAPRVGKGGKEFYMIKLRSMVVKADKTGVSSTAVSDRRITPIGHIIRKLKLDELSQLWNVLIGDMSFVGPRPQVKVGGTDLYTENEKRLLDFKPGITDLASIVFSDEGDILKDSDDADRDYNLLIRPWKSRLALLYVEKQSFKLDLAIIFLTIVAIFSKEIALERVHKLLGRLEAEDELVKIAYRKSPLYAASPP